MSLLGFLRILLTTNAHVSKPVHIFMAERVFVALVLSALIVSAPYVLDRMSPTVSSPALSVPLCPGIHITAVLFDLAGWSSFDQNGDLRLSFTAGVLLSKILVLVFFFFCPEQADTN